MNFDEEISIQFLPSLVADHLLTYLDLYDRLSLRLVCKATKRWIETSDFLQTLQDFPDSPEIIKNQNYILLSSQNRLTINFSDFEDNPSKLNDVFGPNLRFLKLLTFTGQAKELKLLSTCSNLESLSIDILVLTGKPDFPEFKSNAEYELKFSTILGNLEHFKISKISIIYPGGTELEYFGKLLKLLGNLKTLNIPRIQDSSGNDVTTTAVSSINPIEDNRDKLSLSLSINFGFVIGPVIKYISRRTHFSSSQFQSEQSKNLCSLDISNFDLCFFELFPELIKTCSKSGTELANVNFALIRKLIAMRYETKLLRVVRSVGNKLVGNASVFPDLKNVQSLNLDCDRCEIFLPSEINDLLFFPDVKQMELCIWSDTEFSDNVSSPVRDILFRNRPKLRKLTLTCNNRCKLLIPMKEIVQNFVNLTDLRCKTFPMFKDDDLGQILRNLKQLKVLEIDDEWGGITDLGICATDSDTGRLEIFNLTGLVKLRLRIRCKYTGDFYPNGRQYTWPWAKFQRFSNAPNSHFISDYSFKQVFRHLKLKSFLVDSADIHLTKLGYQHLLQGDFAESVEYFPLPEFLPSGLSEIEFYQLRNEFKHFKSFNNNCSANYNDLKDYSENLRFSQDQNGCILS